MALSCILPRSVLTWLVLSLTTPDVATAMDDLEDLLKGKQITITIMCAIADTAPATYRLSQKGNLLVWQSSGSHAELDNGYFKDDSTDIRAFRNGNQVTIVYDWAKMDGARNTTTFRVAGQSCTATWANHPGDGRYEKEIDTTCRATNCSIGFDPTQTSK